ncbi:hypothetical protein PCASD_17084 [Puccinia coronata f. sp. avenae]|uniref:Uncharacterized protein n=1 Tax=Puccinia coronata f. sp. avenae TaxID=200324 RepID=A0A2N5TR25_9BASI|nr:hypothetical protein PCASD_17084 [Puccinia coronata f. sp. avenae]
MLGKPLSIPRTYDPAKVRPEGAMWERKTTTPIKREVLQEDPGSGNSGIQANAPQEKQQRYVHQLARGGRDSAGGFQSRPACAQAFRRASICDPGWPVSEWSHSDIDWLPINCVDIKEELFGSSGALYSMADFSLYLMPKPTPFAPCPPCQSETLASVFEDDEDDHVQRGVRSKANKIFKKIRVKVSFPSRVKSSSAVNPSSPSRLRSFTLSRRASSTTRTNSLLSHESQ